MEDHVEGLRMEKEKLGVEEFAPDRSCIRLWKTLYIKL